MDVFFNLSTTYGCHALKYFVFNVNLIKIKKTCKLLIITLSLYRNTAKDIYITLSKSVIISLSPIIIPIMNCEMDILRHTHFCTLLFLLREFITRDFSQRARPELI